MGEVLKYQVEKCDTLGSIALKFDTDVSWIKETNNLFSDFLMPGMVLTIKPIPEYKKPVKPIFVRSYKGLTDQIGTLILADGILTFEIPRLNYKWKADLVGYVDSAINEVYSKNEITFVLPNSRQKIETSSLVIYVFIYQTMSNDVRSLNIQQFIGIREELTEFDNAVRAQAKALKEDDVPVRLEETKIPEMKTREKEFRPGSFPVCGLMGLFGNLPPQPPPTNKLSDMPPPEPKTMIPKSKKNIPIVTPSPRREVPITINGTSNILSKEEINSIRPRLPFRLKNANWSLTFQLSTDGSSYRTFFEKSNTDIPCLLILKTDDSERIGAFVSRGFKLSKNYYGSGETFVFRFNPNLETFKWVTSANKYFIASTKEEISIGGGGTAAIWIDGSFLNGFSESCPTYGSPPLTARPHYKIMELEVWQLGEHRAHRPSFS